MNEFQFNPKNFMNLKASGGQIARMLLIAEIQTGETPAELLQNLDFEIPSESGAVFTKSTLLDAVEYIRFEISEGRQPEITELEKRQAWAYWTSKPETNRFRKSFGWSA